MAAATAARVLVDKGVEAVLATLGPHGAVLVTAKGAWHASPPPTMVVSTVGAGDSSLFGYLLGDVQGWTPDHRLALAVAYGSAAAGLAGTTIPHPSQVRPELVSVRDLDITQGGEDDRPDHHRSGSPRRRPRRGQERGHPGARRHRRRRRPHRDTSHARRRRPGPRGHLADRPPRRHRDPPLPHGRGRRTDARVRPALAEGRLRRQGRSRRHRVPHRGPRRWRHHPPEGAHEAGPGAGEAGVHRRAAHGGGRPEEVVRLVNDVVGPAPAPAAVPAAPPRSGPLAGSTRHREPPLRRPRPRLRPLPPDRGAWSR